MGCALRFYSLFKSELCVENYVKFNLTSSQRSLTAQLRAGVLPILIETGRFSRIEASQRICILCKSGEVESELHFLLDCKCYDILRSAWLNNVKSNCDNFDSLSVNEKLSLLFLKFHRCTAKFILNSFCYRKEILSRS